MSGSVRPVAIALDVGGTKVEAALVDATGAVLPGSRRRTTTGRATTPEAMTAAIGTVLHGLRDHHPREIAGVGIGSAGPVNVREGTISPVNLPGLRAYPIGDIVARMLAVDSVALALDGQCIALGEARFGAAREVSSVLGMVVSTGVGGGLVVDGSVVRGRSGNAGHVGQLHGDELDANGAPLTVEETSSGPASIAWAQAHGWAGSTGEELGAAALAGDRIASAAIERSIASIGRVIAEVWTLLDLEVAVIGGGFSRVAPDYVDRVEAIARARAVLPYARSPRVTPAALGDTSPLVGAAALVLTAAR